MCMIISVYISVTGWFWVLIEDARNTAYRVLGTTFPTQHCRASFQLASKFFKVETMFSYACSDTQSSEVHIPCIMEHDLSTGEPDHLPSCSEVRHGWTGVKVQLLRHYYVIRSAALMFSSPWGVSKSWVEVWGPVKQYIATLTALLGVVSYCAGNTQNLWAVGMGETRHLSGYFQGLNSLSQF